MAHRPPPRRRIRPRRRRGAPLGPFLALFFAAVAALVTVGRRTDDRVADDLQFAEDETPTSDQSTTSSSAPDDTAEPTTSTTVEDRFDDLEDAPESVRRAVLTAEDLPSGWAPLVGTPRTGEVCPGNDPADEVRPESAVLASFGEPDRGTSLTNLVLQFEDDDAASDYLVAVEDAMAACESYEAEGLQARVDQTRSVDVGDESVTADASATLGEITFNGRLLYVRVGDKVAAIKYLAQGEGDATVAVDALATVVDRL